MKRSEINQKIKLMEKLMEREGVRLPPFLGWTPEDWCGKGSEYDEIRDNLLGWDVTDYGMGKYDELGITLITLRNGNVQNKKYTKTYAEKLIRIQEGQISPMHFHRNKMEDLINKGGGNIIMKLYNATKDNKLDEVGEVEVNTDGRRYMVPAGSEIRLRPGESIALYPYFFHEFWVEPGTGETLVGEVSMCNDDKNDNYFLKQYGRFPTVEEDEPAYRLLCTEYPDAKP